MTAQGPLLRALAERIRGLRTRHGLSLQELADRSNLSRRFLVEIEGGRANPSIARLACLADALRVPLGELCDLPTGPRYPQRIALLGLRGAGKSTLGPRLAERLEIPFHELDRLLEASAGMSTAEIFELEGAAGYLEREARALEEWLARHGSGVLALPGGFVEHEQAYRRLRDTCTTVWLQATPEEHWDRVLAQGDTRPMDGDHRAMPRLRGLLERREKAYTLATVHLSTSGRDPDACVEALRDTLARAEDA